MEELNSGLVETNFDNLGELRCGKVRDIYDLGKTLLIVATDRISAFDVVMPQAVPDKGIMLNRISAFWFNYLKEIVSNHLISDKVALFPAVCQPYAEILRHRSMLVKKAEPLPVECVVRGFLAGSALEEYKEKGYVCGIKLPKAMVEGDKLPNPIFTPATKATTGHDENITFGKASKMLGRKLAEDVRRTSITLYNVACLRAESRGIIIADTKFEFGLYQEKGGERLILIDEALTPDSSRFWPLAEYKPGRPQKSFDKQFLRDYLKSIGWNKQPPAPELPPEVVKVTRQKYIEAYQRLTGETFQLD